ncbi:MAG: VWA domain-containing protein [Planctomycetes bacterium]|nr:VWA domain-containing protein [Planctomycetota bacterium]
MNFLFPAMLAGLAGLALPVVLHLIARSRFPVWPFPTIRLLRYEKRDNVFARKLVDPWQLLLRLLVLALLALAMGRWFMPSSTGKLAPRNLIVVVDASASMRMSAYDTAKESLTGETDESSTTLLDQAKVIARSLLADIALPSRCALVSVGSEVDIVAPLGPTPELALEKLPAIEADDGTGPGLVRAIAECSEMLRGRRETKSQVVVLTDLRSSAFRTRNQRDLQEIADAQGVLGQALEIIIVDIGSSDAENVAIIEAYLRGDEAKEGDTAHIVARVQNLGGEKRDAKLTLTVAGKQEPPFRKLTLAPGEEVIADIPSYANRSTTGFAQVTLKDKDSVMHDNAYILPWVVSRPREVLLVNGSAASRRSRHEESILRAMGGEGDEDAEELETDVIDGAKILKFALNPARELTGETGTGVKTTMITPEVFSAQLLSTYHVIILYDVNALPHERSRKDLDTFARKGGALLLICSKSVVPGEFNPAFAEPAILEGGESLEALSPAMIGIDHVFAPATAMHLSSSRKPIVDADKSVTYLSGPWLASFRNRRQENALAAIRIVQAKGVQKVDKGANILMQADSGLPLALEISRGSGKVILFTFGMELSRSNVAMTKAFPQLVWRLIDYMTGKLRPKPRDLLIASEPAALDASEGEFRHTDSLMLFSENGASRSRRRDKKGTAPDDDADRADQDEDAVNESGSEGADSSVKAMEPLELPVTDRKTVLVNGLPVGRYRLRKAVGTARSYSRPIAVNPDPRESDMSRVEEEDLNEVFHGAVRVMAPAEAAGIAPKGIELWPLVITLLLIAYAAEAMSAYVVGVIRAKKLEAEELEP